MGIVATCGMKLSGEDDDTALFYTPSVVLTAVVYSTIVHVFSAAASVAGRWLFVP